MDTKILIIGEDIFEVYAKAFWRSFLELGYKQAELFATNHYMMSSNPVGKFLIRVQNKLACGPVVRKVNKLLLAKAREKKPDLVFLYTTRVVYPTTIKKIRSYGAKIFMYNNDNPYAPYFPKYFWRNYIGGLKYADKGFVYRQQNVKDYQNSGCADVELLRSYYIKSRNYPLENVGVSTPDVVFLGHHEKDERCEYIKALLDNGIKVGVMKKNWEDFEPENPLLVKLADTHKYYNEMLNSAKIAIVFLSKINLDTYTRRCFEIPATKTLMVAPYTEEIAAMYEEGREVVFYRSKQEFVEKIQYYLEHEEEREKIAIAGYERLVREGHEIGDRVKQVMRAYERICEERQEKNYV